MPEPITQPLKTSPAIRRYAGNPILQNGDVPYTEGLVYSGWVLEDTGELKIYYGAADTVQCLATAHLDDLLALCRPIP